MFTKKRITYGNHPSKFYMVYEPLKDLRNKTVVLIHGGFWQSKWGLETMEPLAEALVQEGYRVVNLEYPRVGDTIAFTALEMIHIIFKTFDRIVDDLHIKESVVIGHSAGGYYALMLAMRERIGTIECTHPNIHVPHTVIAIAPITDLWKGHRAQLSDSKQAIFNFVNSQNNGEPASQAFYDTISPISYEIPSKATVHIMHGTLDTEVPIQQTDDFILMNTDGQVGIHDGNWNHYQPIDPKHTDTWDELLRILK